LIQNGASPFSEPEIVYARKTDLEELARLRKEREWQPIETAPKDGSAFLAWEDGDRGPFKCWWHTDWPRAEAPIRMAGPTAFVFEGEWLA